MISLKVCKIQKYRGCNILVRQINEIYYEYIIFYRDKVYSDWIKVKKTFFNRLLRVEFSDGEVKDIVRVLLMGAHKTIDGLKKDKLTKKKDEKTGRKNSKS